MLLNPLKAGHKFKDKKLTESHLFCWRIKSFRRIINMQYEKFLNVVLQKKKVNGA